MTIQSTGTKYVIYTPGVFLQDVQDYVAHYWETRGGYVPIIVNTDTYPQPPDHDGFRQTLKASIVSYAGQGARYFHLIGDWNDWREFVGDLYPTLWVGPWVTIREQQLRDRPPGQQAKDLIPSYVVPDTLPPGQNMAYGTPYWFSDLDYADTDGDLIPNVVLTRWPVADANEVVALALKMQGYNDLGEYPNPLAVSLYVYDRDYEAGSGDGQRAGAVADAVIAEIPPGHYASRLNATQYEDLQTWRAAALSNWNNSLPEVVVMAASLSSRYSPGELSFSIESLTSNTKPLILGASCATGDFARTENLGLPRFHRLLTAPYQGPIAWVGPTASTWQDANEVVARYVARRRLRSWGLS